MWHDLVLLSPAFAPFLEETFKHITLIVDHPAPEVRKSALAAMGQFCIAANNLMKADASKADGELKY